MKTITALTAFAFAGLTGCYWEGPLEVSCTDIMMWSVELELEDESGMPLLDAAVTVTDGITTEECSTGGEGFYYCGQEMGGDLTISVSAAGYYDEDIDVTVTSDECHVVQESITHTMASVDCTTEIATSVVVTVGDEAGGPIEGVAVGYVPVSDDIGADVIDCEGESELFFCGEEVAGDLEILVSAEGYQPHSEVVTVAVSDDGCHVITEDLDVVLLAE